MRAVTFLYSLLLVLSICFSACNSNEVQESKADQPDLVPEYTLNTDQTHNKFSRLIPPAITVPSGAIVEAYTEEASDEQITRHSTTAGMDTTSLNYDLIHPLTGPVFVEGAEPGAVL